MNLPTTTEEIESLFRAHWNDPQATKDIKPLYQLAHKSEFINGCAAGLFQTIAQGISIGGINPAPVFAAVLMGFRLGAIYASGALPMPMIETLQAIDPEVAAKEAARAAYAEWLANNPEPKQIEGGEDAKA